MTSAAPLSSTIVSIGLIPVAFFFIHAFVSGWKTKKFHAVSGFIAIVWDLTLSIGYMLYRTFGGEVGGSALNTASYTAYFAFHGAIAVIVMLLEIGVLALGLRQLQVHKKLALHGKLAKVLFGIWWVAFLSGELFYLVMYVL